MATQKSNKGQNTATRTRNYATVLYPESAPADWMDILSMQFVPCFISPLHENDVNPTGEPKKAHYHIMLMFDNVKTKEQATAIFDKIGGVGCEAVNSIRGYARYLCHLDNPEKAQYSIDEVKALCGADYRNVIGLPTDRKKAIREMMCYCRENNIVSFSDLFEYSSEYRDDWFDVLITNGAFVMKEYLKSKSWTFSYKLMAENNENSQGTRNDTP